MDRISKVQELIEEYASCREEFDSRKVAGTIDDLYREAQEPSPYCEPSWHHLNNMLGVKGAERRYE